MPVLQVMWMYVCMYVSVHMYMNVYMYVPQTTIVRNALDWKPSGKTQIYHSLYIKLSSTHKSIQAILLGVIYAGD